jgi:hypothetical protein
VILCVFSPDYWPFLYFLWRNICSSYLPIFNFVDYFIVDFRFLLYLLISSTIWNYFFHPIGCLFALLEVSALLEIEPLKCDYIHRKIYYKDLVHVIMVAGMSKYVICASRLITQNSWWYRWSIKSVFWRIFFSYLEGKKNHLFVWVRPLNDWIRPTLTVKGNLFYSTN